MQGKDQERRTYADSTDTAPPKQLDNPTKVVRQSNIKQADEQVNQILTSRELSLEFSQRISLTSECIEQKLKIAYAAQLYISRKRHPNLQWKELTTCEFQALLF